MKLHKLKFWKSNKRITLDPDLSDFKRRYSDCLECSMTSVERAYSLHRAVQYIIENNIQGDFVECGVWRGGSAMVMAKTLKEIGVTDRKIYLYDTFEGMPPPTEKDFDLNGKKADEILQNHKNKKEESVIWAIAKLSNVQYNLGKMDYPNSNLVFVQGKVEDTIPNKIPDRIALLRLDTDWYESTLHELNHLYPLLEKSGVLIIDDYGHWIGAKKAVDEYFEIHKPAPLLSRIDYTGRLAIKVNE